MLNVLMNSKARKVVNLAQNIEDIIDHLNSLDHN